MNTKTIINQAVDVISVEAISGFADRRNIFKHFVLFIYQLHEKGLYMKFSQLSLQQTAYEEIEAFVS